MNERIYNQPVDRLRSAERMARLEVAKVTELCMKDHQLKSMLDVGTGSGIFAEAFNKNGLIAAGIDLNDEMIKLAGEYLPGCLLLKGIAEELPFEDCSYDMVFMGLVFHEVSDYLKAMREAFRVSVKCAAILEWQYVSEQAGPPIEHRLKGEFVREIGLSAGFAKFTEYKLNQLVLYILEK